VARPVARRAGVTLLELMVVLGLVASLLAFLGSVLLGVQRETVDAVALQDATGRARHVTQTIIRELRDLHLSADDLEPDAPFECRDLRYRIAIDHDGVGAIVDPPASSGLFRGLRLVGGRLERVAPDGEVVALADQIEDMTLTLLAPDRLRIRVTVRRRGAGGASLFGIDDVTVLLRNQG
jgi:prepilin-type N-terminal cleavage/methylation domain-containing protein